MMPQKNVTVAIPARLASTRLPGKILLEIAGKSILQHVYERVRAVKQNINIVILTDDEKVFKIAEKFCDQVIMTSPECSCGTARIVSVLDQLSGDWIVNVQGDEPFLDPQLLEQMIDHLGENDADILTPIREVEDVQELNNPNRVKVAVTDAGRALYFSRSPIPYLRGRDVIDWLQYGKFYTHIGVYGYSRRFLQQYPRLKADRLETMESLEQLRFLAAGYMIQTFITPYRSITVDTADDLAYARQYASKRCE